MKLIKIICKKCGGFSEKPIKEINRQLKGGRHNFYCSLKCAMSDIKTTTKDVIRKCLWCKNDFWSSTHKKHRLCCNKNCASKYSQSKVDISIHLQSIRNTKREKTFPRIKIFECVVCKSSFKKIVKNNVEIKKTCSNDCYSKLMSKYARENPNCGGELGYKQFVYNGIKMDSSWEVEIANWMDVNCISWERSRKLHMFWWVDENGDKRKYFPDFYLPKYNVYLDPKNDYKLSKDLYKLNKVI